MAKWTLRAPCLSRLNLFYILAFIPLVLIQFYGYISRSDFFAALIPLYGFLLLWIKQDKLSAFSEPSQVYRLMGLALMLASFFIYFFVALFYPQAQFYGVSNYLVYLVGLFLAFFQPLALKESFTTMFLLIMAASTSYIGEWIEHYLQPLVPFFVQITALVLRTLGISFTLNQNTFFLHTLVGEYQSLSIIPQCIGIYSFLIFAILVVVTMAEDPSSMQTKLVWSVVGVIGTFITNIIRVSLIFVGTYFYGFETWSGIHSVAGYVLFIAWLTLFLLIFSKRETISEELTELWKRIRVIR